MFRTILSLYHDRKHSKWVLHSVSVPTFVALRHLPAAKAGSASSAAARSRGKKFFLYYKPYLDLFFVDMACKNMISNLLGWSGKPSTPSASKRPREPGPMSERANGFSSNIDL